MKDTQYIIIDEMSFIGSKLFVQIDRHTCEGFSENNNYIVGYWSTLLIGHRGQLTLVMDKPMYTRQLLEGLYGQPLHCHKIGNNITSKGQWWHPGPLSLDVDKHLECHSNNRILEHPCM